VDERVKKERDLNVFLTKKSNKKEHTHEEILPFRKLKIYQTFQLVLSSRKRFEMEPRGFCRK
jgi:hypothetical protein